jgi:hypothetical protein
MQIIAAAPLGARRIEDRRARLPAPDGETDAQVRS